MSCYSVQQLLSRETMLVEVVLSYSFWYTVYRTLNFLVHSAHLVVTC